MERLNDLVFVHNHQLRTRQIMDRDTNPIMLEKVNPKPKRVTEPTNHVFADKDLKWSNQENREAKILAMAEKDKAWSCMVDVGHSGVS